MMVKVARSLFVVLLVFIVNVSLCPECFSAEKDRTSQVSNKVSKAIIQFLVSKDSKFLSKKVSVEYKYADKIFKDLSYRKGDVTFTIVEMYPDFKPLGNVIIPVQVVVDGEDKEKIFLRTKVSVFDRIVVAGHRLEKGNIIGSAEVVLDERDIAVINQEYYTDIDQLLGKEVKTYIPKGNTIYNWMIKQKSLIKKNDKVRIISTGEAIVLEVQGLALQDGVLGQQIMVRNIDSGKEIDAIVAGATEVIIK